VTILPVAAHPAWTLAIDGDGTAGAGDGDAVRATVGTGVEDSAGRDGVDVWLGVGIAVDEHPATITDTRTAAGNERSEWRIE
jgi:hypothetical protein